jgi:hypothetical protein
MDPTDASCPARRTRSEGTEPHQRFGNDNNCRNPAERRGLAMFGVLVLVVVFTLLGVGAITLATRENQNSGSILDIKSRQSAAYAGLSFALGEFQRDPANFVGLLEAWRTKSTALYGTPSNPLPQLYFQFSSTGGAVTLTKTKPAAFAIPGTPYSVLVELAGVMVPTTSGEAPAIVLRSTGTGRSGDAQTIVGTYRVRNVRLNSTSGAALAITHPFYVNCGGTWNNNIETSGGDVFMGGNTHLNSAVNTVNIQGGGLRVRGDFNWDASVNVNISGNSWITGDMSVKGGSSGDAKVFGKHLVVDGNVTWLNSATLTVDGAFVIGGTTGTVDLHGGDLNVGTGSPAIANSQLYVPFQKITGSDVGSKINVANGSAYLYQLDITSSKPITLDVPNGRLELADHSAVKQTFVGSGTWSQFVARSMASGSLFKDPGGMAPSITIKGTSWVESPDNTILGTAASGFGWSATPANPLVLNVGARIYHPNCGWGCTMDWTLSGGSEQVGNPPGINTAAEGLTSEGFDLANPPVSVAGLGMGISPTSDNEMGFDITADPTVLSKAFTATPGPGYCHDNSSTCGSWMNKQRLDDIAAGSPHFYNGYFVYKLDNFPFCPAKMSYDLGGTSMAPLVGKWLIIVNSNMASAANPWPTTATNSDPANPANIQFIYVPKGSGGAIFPGFQPRTSSSSSAPAVEFYGYVRDDEMANNTWDPKGGVNFHGAMHIMGPTTGSFTTNSGSLLPSFTLDPAVLNDLGSAFGKLFKDPVTNQPVVSNVAAGFVATETWIQFQTVSELR